MTALGIKGGNPDFSWFRKMEQSIGSIVPTEVVLRPGRVCGQIRNFQKSNGTGMFLIVTAVIFGVLGLVMGVGDLENFFKPGTISLMLQQTVIVGTLAIANPADRRRDDRQRPQGGVAPGEAFVRALSQAAQACAKIRQLSVAPLMAETIQRIASGESVMSLFADQDNLF